MNQFDTLSIESTEQHIQTVVLDRPNVMNALNTQMMTDIRDHFQSLYVDAGDIRVVIIKGRGDRAFCAGGDLKERNGMTDAVWRKQHAILEQMVKEVMACPVPVIAAVQGACFGGGLELALLADFIYSSPESRFGFPEGRLGIMPGACGTQNLVRACGSRRAKEIMLTGSSFSAEEGRDWGIVNSVVSESELDQAVLSVANEVCQTAPISARLIKQSLDVATQTDLNNGYAFEIAAYNRTVPSDDRREGVLAFNEKRKPRFTGQ